MCSCIGWYSQIRLVKLYFEPVIFLMLRNHAFLLFYYYLMLSLIRVKEHLKHIATVIALFDIRILEK